MIKNGLLVASVLSAFIASTASASELIVDNPGYIHQDCQWINRYSGYGFTLRTLNCNGSDVLAASFRSGHSNGTIDQSRSSCTIDSAAPGYALQDASGRVVTQIVSAGTRSCNFIRYTLKKI